MVAAFGGWNDAAAAASNALAFVGERLGPTGRRDRPGGLLRLPGHPPPGGPDLAGARRIVWPEVEILAAGCRRRATTWCWRRRRALDALAHLLPAAARRRRRARRAPRGDAGLAARRRGPQPPGAHHRHGLRPTFIADLGFRQPSYAGPTGIVGVLHNAASDAGFETVSMWAPVSHYAAGLTNAKGSLALVRALEHGGRRQLDVGELEEAAATFEGQVARAVEAEPRLRRSSSSSRTPRARRRATSPARSPPATSWPRSWSASSASRGTTDGASLAPVPPPSPRGRHRHLGPILVVASREFRVALPGPGGGLSAS